MKISGWHKEQGDTVDLLTRWGGYEYDKVYLSKVFTDTEVPQEILDMSNLTYGGTGFFYDKAPALKCEIEHHMPDYHLYDEWVQDQIQKGANRTEFKYYLDYSIGFMTRGCFRQCEFCVNRNYKRATIHSPIEEFLDPHRKKICLLDDNFLSHPDWKIMLKSLQDTGKRFQFKQGLDERILTDEKCQLLFNSKYDGEYIFAFDNVADYEIIEKKLKLIRKYTDKIPKFYVFCGFDRSDNWSDFWYQDIVDIFKRIDLLMRYRCLPYIMRFNRYTESPFRGIYVTLARWCNQPSMFKKKSFEEFCAIRSDSQKYLDDFLSKTNFQKDHQEYLTMRFPN